MASVCTKVKYTYKFATLNFTFLKHAVADKRKEYVYEENI